MLEWLADRGPLLEHSGERVKHRRSEGRSHHHGAAHGSFSPVDESRVLVVSASMGGGHDGAGRELLRRLHDRGHAAQMVDFLDAFPMRMGWLVRAGYWFELRYAPWSYEATYRLWYVLPFVFQPLGAFINLLTRRRMLRWVRQAKADVVVSTYPMASLVLGAARQKGLLRIPVATFITDFAVHPLWTHPGVDLHMCVHPQSAEAAASRSGRAASAPGPMVPERFHTELPDRTTARQSLGFDDDERLVLVVAGAWGIGRRASGRRRRAHRGPRQGQGGAEGRGRGCRLRGRRRRAVSRPRPRHEPGRSCDDRQGPRHVRRRSRGRGAHARRRFGARTR